MTGFHYPQRCRKTIGVFKGTTIPPPCRDIVLTDPAIPRELQAEENQNSTDRHTRIESGRQHVVVLAPPSKVPPPDPVLEDETDNTPRYVVDSGSGWDITRTRVDNGEVDVFNDGVRVAACNEVRDARCDGSNKEEENETIVDLTFGKLTSWSDHTPDDGSRSKDFSRGANEVIMLVRVAHVINIREHPGLHTKLYCASQDGCDDLAKEHRALRNLHVVTQFKIGSELKSLSHGDISPGFEQHHCYWATGKSITNDELGDDIQPNLLIGNGLNHPNRNHVYKSNAQSKNEGPNRHLRRPDFDGNNTNREHR